MCECSILKLRYPPMPPKKRSNQHSLDLGEAGRPKFRGGGFLHSVMMENAGNGWPFTIPAVQALGARERLEFHQQHSQPLMATLQKWMEEQFAERKVELNSGLGKAIAYLQKHWDKLTLFLREAGAPLDNNICEQALKLVVLHRKNALFYRTMNGARVGDLFMSLIHTCGLNGVNSFDYLLELLRHTVEIAASPPDWMPWNYRQTLARTAAAA